MDELLKLEQLALQITKETAEILEKNFPLDSREFLTGEDARKVKENDEKIREVSDSYGKVYMALSDDEKRKVVYRNIQGTYYQSTHQSKGLVSVSEYSDEYELSAAFSRASSFGIKALDEILLGENNNDQAAIERGRRILNTCKDILSVHFWGEDILAKFDRYEKRIRSGRTVEEDLDDYDNLVKATRELAYEYAKARLSSPTEQQMEDYFNKFEELFAKGKLLSEFIPRDIFSNVYVNLHWLKVDAERDPQKVIDEYNQGFGLK